MPGTNCVTAEERTRKTRAEFAKQRRLALLVLKDLPVIRDSDSVMGIFSRIH